MISYTDIDFSILDIESVLYIHEVIIDRSGGKQGIRDYGLLHSALERPKAAFASQDLYPTTLHKAAALMHSLVMNHAFLDGNKRTAYAVMVRFLNANNYKVKATTQEIINLCLAIDNQSWTPNQIHHWLTTHTTKAK